MPSNAFMYCAYSLFGMCVAMGANQSPCQLASHGPLNSTEIMEAVHNISELKCCWLCANEKGCVSYDYHSPGLPSDCINTAADCFYEDCHNVQNYTGFKNLSRDGHPCLHWDSDELSEEDKVMQFDHNYCRNPTKENGSSSPGCFVHSGTRLVRYASCFLPCAAYVNSTCLLSKSSNKTTLNEKAYIKSNASPHGASFSGPCPDGRNCNGSDGKNSTSMTTEPSTPVPGNNHHTTSDTTVTVIGFVLVALGMLIMCLAIAYMQVNSRSRTKIIKVSQLSPPDTTKTAQGFLPVPPVTKPAGQAGLEVTFSDEVERANNQQQMNLSTSTSTEIDVDDTLYDVPTMRNEVIEDAEAESEPDCEMPPVQTAVVQELVDVDSEPTNSKQIHFL